MSSYLLGQSGWVIIFILAILYFSYLSVKSFRKKNIKDISYKYIPAITAFVVVVNSICVFIFGADVVLSNILNMFLLVALLGISFLMFWFCLFIAFIFDIRSYLKSRKKGAEPNEQ